VCLFICHPVLAAPPLVKSERSLGVRTGSHLCNNKDVIVWSRHQIFAVSGILGTYLCTGHSDNKLLRPTCGVFGDPLSSASAHLLPPPSRPPAPGLGLVLVEAGPDLILVEVEAGPAPVLVDAVCRPVLAEAEAGPGPVLVAAGSRS
jgi:hypothetical protein